jgi:hypothetical protein
MFYQKDSKQDDIIVLSGGDDEVDSISDHIEIYKEGHT